MVVAGKVLGMPVDVLQRILLFLNSSVSHSVQRVYALARLYDELTPEIAQRLVAIWRNSQPREGKSPEAIAQSNSIREKAHNSPRTTMASSPITIPKANPSRRVRARSDS
jgi:hypothetical protein